MLRSVGAFVLGWVVMGVVVMASFVVGPLLLGIDRVLEPGTYEATTLWIVLAMGIGLAAGVAGGWIAAHVGRGRGPVVALAVLMLGTTTLTEILKEPRPADAPVVERPADQGLLEVFQAAQEHGHEPLATRIGNPLFGLIGLALGAALAERRRRRES